MLGIVIPTRNDRPESLRRCLQSVLRCDVKEIVIVAPAPLLRDADLPNDPRLNFVEDEGIGAAAAINKGLVAFSDNIQVVGWIGDDDTLDATGIQASMNELSASDATIATFGICEYEEDDGTKWNYNPGQTAARSAGRVINRIPQPGSLFKRFARGCDFKLDERYKYVFDEELFVRLSKEGSIVFVPHKVATYSWHPASLSFKNRGRAIREALKLRWLSCSVTQRFLYAPVWAASLLDSYLPSRRVSRIRVLG